MGRAQRDLVELKSETARKGAGACDAAARLRDKTRPPGIAPVADDRAAANWTLRAMAKAVGLAASTVQKIWKAHGLAP